MCSPHCDLLEHRTRHSFPVCLAAQQEPMTGEAHVHKSYTRTIHNAAAQTVHPHLSQSHYQPNTQGGREGSAALSTRDHEITRTCLYVNLGNTKLLL